MDPSLILGSWEVLPHPLYLEVAHLKYKHIECQMDTFLITSKNAISATEKTILPPLPFQVQFQGNLCLAELSACLPRQTRGGYLGLDRQEGTKRRQSGQEREEVRLINMIKPA